MNIKQALVTGFFNFLFLTWIIIAWGSMLLVLGLIVAILVCVFYDVGIWMGLCFLGIAIVIVNAAWD